MSEGHGRDAWARASHLLALIANVNRDPKKHRPFKPSQFSPYPDESRPRVATKSDLQALKQQLGIKEKRDDSRNKPQKET